MFVTVTSSTYVCDINLCNYLFFLKSSDSLCKSTITIIYGSHLMKKMMMILKMLLKKAVSV